MKFGWGKRGNLVLANEPVISVEGFLNHEKGKALFEDVKGELGKDFKIVVLDMGKVEGVDSLGGAWLLSIKQYASIRGTRVEFRNARESVSEFMRMIGPGIRFISMKPPSPPDFFESLGDAVYQGIKESRDAFALILDSVYWTFIAPIEGKKVRWNSLLEELHEMGFKAVWIVILINYLLGFIVAMLAAAQVRKFGAGIYVADLVSIGFARELAPIMTAIIVSARSGAAIASEIGTMKVQEEIDALKAMGFPVSHFLIAPKILAMLVALPCLVLLGMGAGVWGGFHVGRFILGVDSGQWIQETLEAVMVSDLVQGLSKSIVFAVIIVMVGCHNGLRVSGGARGVGLVTTRAVVMDIFFIISFDVVFATLFYYTF